MDFHTNNLRSFSPLGKPKRIHRARQSHKEVTEFEQTKKKPTNKCFTTAIQLYS